MGLHPIVVGMVWQQVIAHMGRKHLEDWKLSPADHLRGGPWQVLGAEHMSLWGHLTFKPRHRAFLIARGHTQLKAVYKKIGVT